MQKIMTLDIEMTQPGRKIIQIGAAIYDIRNAACYGTLEIFVNPGELISEEITRLTGITNEDVAHGYGICEAYHKLKDFHDELKPFRNPLVWGSGLRNDSSHIFEEYINSPNWSDMLGNPDKENFMGFRVLDAKTLYQSIMLFENKSYAGNLKDSMKRLGLQFEGREHTALADAKNTFAIWYHLIRKMHDGFKARK